MARVRPSSATVAGGLLRGDGLLTLSGANGGTLRGGRPVQKLNDLDCINILPHFMAIVLIFLLSFIDIK